MDCNQHEIKSKKQENGCWGTPMECRYIQKVVNISEENSLKESAILIAMAEHHRRSFEVRFVDETGFVIFFDNREGSIFKRPISIKYDKWQLDGNIIKYIGG